MLYQFEIRMRHLILWERLANSSFHCDLSWTLFNSVLRCFFTRAFILSCLRLRTIAKINKNYLNLHLKPLQIICKYLQKLFIINIQKVNIAVNRFLKTLQLTETRYKNYLLILAWLQWNGWLALLKLNMISWCYLKCISASWGD